MGSRWIKEEEGNRQKEERERKLISRDIVEYRILILLMSDQRIDVSRLTATYNLVIFVSCETLKIADHICFKIWFEGDQYRYTKLADFNVN